MKEFHAEETETKVIKEEKPLKMESHSAASNESGRNVEAKIVNELCKLEANGSIITSSDVATLLNKVYSSINKTNGIWVTLLLDPSISGVQKARILKGYLRITGDH
ncbi:hypothetical protein CASFOL_030072 [Castilleja foliolosa]|uniref:Uncharacterized protein n=1 Tax=Castilleja foliolosa TaxID=1961234 RepID=A0ABD3CAC0_9LAMI